MQNIMELMQLLQGNANPMSLLQNMAGQDPIIGKAMQMVQGKSPDEVMQIANNLAQTQGKDINQVKKQLGF